MDELIGFLAGFVIIAAIIGAIFYNIAQALNIDITTLVSALFLILFFGGIGLWMFFEHRKQKKFAAAPLDGPMKVDLTTSREGSKHRLHIKVIMSQKDQNALERSGLEMHSLFRFPDPRFTDQDVDYRNCHLFNTPYVDFPNIQDLDKAKAELIEGLHALRSRLDEMKERRGPQKESLEI